MLCGGHIEDTSSRDSKLKTAVINYIDQLIKLSSATKIDDQVADTHKISYDARRYYGFLVNARNNIDNLANGSKKEYGEFLTDISNCMGKIIAAIDGILMNQSENPALKEALQPHEA